MLYRNEINTAGNITYVLLPKSAIFETCFTLVKLFSADRTRFTKWQQYIAEKRYVASVGDRNDRLKIKK